MPSGSQINESLIEETKHWLEEYSDSLKLYKEALAKFQNEVFRRNLLDDLCPSLENQIGLLGEYLKKKGGSKELTNMFVKLVEYFGKYQNTYVKHYDAVIEEEIEFIFEITSSFMKHIVKLS